LVSIIVSSGTTEENTTITLEADLTIPTDDANTKKGIVLFAHGSGSMVVRRITMIGKDVF
jgi:hypothetical protein